jgi:hypothetical protein
MFSACVTPKYTKNSCTSRRRDAVQVDVQLVIIKDSVR